mmetsp:Transcript_12707/g.23028  ORF Transcript_12707/g.23028 Transcript_12707/m.23028 type:complete len:233 (-) Transcript_12707:18-716(-)
MSSLDPMASPRRSGGKCDVKDLKLERVLPRISLRPFLSSSVVFDVAALVSALLSALSSSSVSMMELGALNNTLRMAWVAQALWVTCLAKNNPSGQSSPTSALPLSTLPPSSSLFTSSASDDDDDCHLNRKINPWTAAFSTPSMGRMSWRRESSSRLQSSANSTFWVPNDSIKEVNTPGSDSMVHQSSFEDAIIAVVLVVVCWMLVRRYLHLGQARELAVTRDMIRPKRRRGV